MASIRKRRTDRLVPLAEGLFTIPSSADEPPQLLASRCEACGELFFPPRRRCTRCFSTELTEATLGPEGRLYTWTVVREFGGRSEEFQPYAVGMIQLDEALRVQGYIVEAELEALAVDMPMRLVLRVLSRDEQGNDVVTYAFTPTEATS